MLIANPIYDTVFKYLMSNLEIAKGVIATIIDEDIVTLDFKTRENVFKHPVGGKPQNPEKVEDETELVYHHLDFIAKIRLPDGHYKNVLIELQKTNIRFDILRFRTYLGEQYKRKDEVVKEDGTVKSRCLPIITIYFLGFYLSQSLPQVIKVNREYIDVLTGEPISERNYFIEELTHDSYVIQIPGLKVKLRNRLECILSVFQQENFIGGKQYLKNFAHDTDDELTAKMIKQLEKAAADEDLYRQLELEELAQSEYENAFGKLEQQVEEQLKQLTENAHKLEQNAHKLEQNAHKLKQKDQQLEQKDQQLEQKDQALEQKERQIRELMEKLKAQG